MYYCWWLYLALRRVVQMLSEPVHVDLPERKPPPAVTPPRDVVAVERDTYPRAHRCVQSAHRERPLVR